jgi:hypothetical protein
VQLRSFLSGITIYFEHVAQLAKKEGHFSHQISFILVYLHIWDKRSTVLLGNVAIFSRNKVDKFGVSLQIRN